MEYSETGDIERHIEKRKLKRDYWSEVDLLKHMIELIDAFSYM